MGLKLGDVSPAAGIISGKGLFGKMADKGMLGLGSRMIASSAQEKDEEKARKAAEAAAAGQPAPAAGMKKGGKVAGKLAKRGYGCVKK
jgi:hypothetical protein